MILIVIIGILELFHLLQKRWKKKITKFINVLFYFIFSQASLFIGDHRDFI